VSIVQTLICLSLSDITFYVLKCTLHFTVTKELSMLMMMTTMCKITYVLPLHYALFD